MTEVLDMRSRTFEPGPDLTEERRGSAAVALDDESGQLIVIGGIDDSAAP